MLQMNMNTVSEREFRGPMPRHAANIPVRVQIERSAIVGAQGTRRKAVSLQDKRVYIVSRIPASYFCQPTSSFVATTKTCCPWRTDGLPTNVIAAKAGNALSRPRYI